MNAIEYTVLRELVDNLTSGIMIEDENRIIVKSNNYLSEMFGMPGPHALAGMDCAKAGEQFSEMFTDPVEFLSNVEDILENKICILNDIIYLSNGRIFERDYIPISIDGDYRGHVWHYRDITVRTKMEKYLTAQSKNNTYILANIGHEIRNPLNCIIGMSELMSISGDLTPDHLDYVRAINQSGVNILQILDTITERAAGIAPKKTQFSLAKCFRNISGMMAKGANDKNLSLDFDIRPSTDIFTGYETYIKQIITNLVSNAIKYTSKGSILVRCTSTVAGNLKLQVIDSGAGIPEDKHSIIFSAFSQLDANKPGIGMGLNIVSELVTFMGGSIKVESKVNVGSIFEVVI